MRGYFFSNSSVAYLSPPIANGGRSDSSLRCGIIILPFRRGPKTGCDSISVFVLLPAAAKNAKVPAIPSTQSDTATSQPLFAGVLRLANALVELANDPRERERFGRAAISRVDQLFRLEACVTEYEEIYDSLFEHPAAVSKSGELGSFRATEPDSLV